MENSASDLSQQSAQDEEVTKEASESVADMKAKLCHEGGGDILKRSGDKSSINHIQNGVNGAVSQSRHSSSSKSKEHGSSSKHGSSGSSSHKHSTSAGSHKHDQGSSSHKYVSSSSGSSSKHKEGSSSSSGKHRDGSSSSKDKHGEKISSKEKHSEDRSSNKEKQGNERLSSGEKQSSSSRGEDKHESSSSSKDKAKHNSSSNYSREKEKSSDKLKSSASGKEGDKHKSSSSNKHEDKEREKSKERSSSKHKEGSSGGSGERKKEEKPKGIDRPKDTRDVEKDKEKSSDKVVDLKPKIKEEPKSPVKEYSPVKDNFISSGVKKEIKQSPESDDDLPLAQRVNQDKPEKAVKRPAKDDADDDEPLAGRLEMVKKIKKEEPPSKPVKKRKAEESYDDKPLKKVKKVKKEGKQEREEPEEGKKKRGKKDDEQPEVWKWWEEEKRGDGVKWTFLEHKGPVFAPLYEPLPDDINFYYDGKKIKLSLPAEEVATFYARMLDHDYTTCDVFNNNFFKDWRKMMTPEEKSTITDLKKCNFKEMFEYFKAKSEERKNMSEEEKKKIKAQNEAIQKEYGICMMDGHPKKIANFRLEPPGLFRGRGNHPKQGMLKMRIKPEDVIINCSSDSKIPQPPAGHRWKKVLHDNKVTWLASWTENIQGHTKYVILNAPLKLKGEKGLQKYEIARKLHIAVDNIRAQYREDWKSKDMSIQQKAVALYFIDKLALRAGNEKEEGETADTVGCCSLRVEHIKLHDELDGKENVVEFGFLGKDSIHYYNTVSVDKRVYTNLKIFMDNKQPGDYLFDCLNTSIMNKHLKSLMEGLTADMFHTFNASKTLQEQLNLLTNPDDPVPAKLLSYNRANRAVAILCNHHLFSEQMETLQSKAENIEIALDSFKLNYLDPRISVAWCKKYNVPLEKIYSETHLTKFSWAIISTEPNFEY